MAQRTCSYIENGLGLPQNICSSFPFGLSTGGALHFWPYPRESHTLRHFKTSHSPKMAKGCTITDNHHLTQVQLTARFHSPTLAERFFPLLLVRFLLPRPAERSKGFLRVPGCCRADTEELTPKSRHPAHIRHTQQAFICQSL